MKLPIGIQTFKKIREKDYIYIDKTKEAFDIINNYTYVFLSRPRRFGKSLFLDTLKNIFEGNKELFKGLYIYDKWDFNIKYPVIKISFDGKLRSIKDLENVLLTILSENQEKLGIKCESKDATICFRELIIKASKKYNQRVVVLIDEYDKPILDVIEDIDKAKEHREYIKGLYSVLKGVDEYIKFVFLTGVSKFSKASIFSGLNMLENISLIREFGNVCGYTHKELIDNFKEYLDGVDLEKVKEWYNGYYFLKDRVYNPFDVLKYLKYKEFKNYWFSSGTPTFLIKLIQKNNYFLPKLLNLIVGEEIVNSFDIENIKLEVIMYQSGYLTIDKVIVEELGFNQITKYKLTFPNLEVKTAFNNYILEYLFNQSNGEKIDTQINIYKSLAKGNLEEFKNILVSLFASIPYNNYVNNRIYEYEGFYASIIYVYLQSLGIDIIGEDVTNKGRVDLTLFIEDKIYIIEFKVVKEKEGIALKQLKEKKYHKKYLNKNKDIYLVGIEFSKEEKNICNFKYEKVKE